MKQRILIIEDDADIRQLLSVTLLHAGFEVSLAASGEVGLEIALECIPDLVILDLMLPRMSGQEVCRTLKKSSQCRTVPVVMLTALGEEQDRIEGLEIGADDYMVKPFSPRELVLRIQAILKRVAGSQAPAGTSIEVDGLRLSFDTHAFSLDGKEVFLTPTEFRLLCELLQNRGKVRTREQLLSTVWGYAFDGYARTVDTHIRRLRLKLEHYAEQVETIRGIGYRFKE